MAGAARSLGPTLAAGCALAAIRDPSATALVDERGAVTWDELRRRSSAVAAALAAEHAVGPGRAVALMCRNHRGFVEALLAASRLGADVLMLNTDFPGPQLGQALERNPPAVIVLDEEFGDRFDAAGFEGPRVLAWHDESVDGPPTLEALAATGGRPPPPSGEPGRIIVLSSGTTGAPKGAGRSPSPAALAGPMTTLFEQIPLRAGEPILVAPPLFHGFGLAYLGIAVFLRMPLVLLRRFDARAALDALETQRAHALVAVPVMLARILAVHEEEGRSRDLASLRAVMSAGAPLSAQLATDFMDAFGDVLFNLYGSTETGFGAIAGPADLRAAPGTVGRPPLATPLKILGPDRRELPPGEPGHIFLGGGLVFGGYEGGGSKETLDGLMNTGDVGHLDAEGRLFVEGREDDMIVSGGENVFPDEVGDVLAGHPAVADVAVLGVEDAEFGQRLRAFVVREPGADPAPEELAAHVKERLARYKVPRDFVFVDEIPRNQTGKVLRRELVDFQDRRSSWG
jgi:acyl-CoA synthetase (AMP-forming)/AMP-acid ligase II